MRKYIAGLILAAGFGASQSRPSFEVASIKPSSGDMHRTMVGIQPGGRFNASGVTTKLLIQQAYGIKDFQITGGPGWIGSDRYDISAKPEGPANQDQLKLMLQSLLEDRFQLKMHPETKEMPVYALVVAKDGPKLKEVNEPAPDSVETGGRGNPGGRGGRQGLMRMGRGQLSGQAVGLDMLVTQLSNILGRAVIDKTGLKGKYDLTLEWAPDESQGMMFRGGPPDAGATSPDTAGPSIFTALQEQLGLRLESQKGAVQIFVVDRVEKPSEN